MGAELEASLLPIDGKDTIEARDQSKKYMLARLPKPVSLFSRSFSIDTFYNALLVSALSIAAFSNDFNTIDDVLQYIGFFVVTWSSWYLNTTYRCHFSGRSWVDSFAQASHCFMLFLFTASGADIHAKSHGLVNFANTPIQAVVIGSRALLLLQCMHALWQRWDDERSRTHLAFNLNLKAAALVFYVLLFKQHFQPLFCSVAVLECIIETVINAPSNDAEPSHFNLTERMETATYTMLGSSFLAFAKLLSDLLNSDRAHLEIMDFGNVVCFLPLMYLLYKLYCPHDHGHADVLKHRYTAWIIQHGPLHFGLVLSITILRRSILQHETPLATLQIGEASIGLVAVSSTLVSLALLNVLKEPSNIIQPALLVLVVFALYSPLLQPIWRDADASKLSSYALPILVTLLAGVDVLVERLSRQSSSQDEQELGLLDSASDLV